jgi:hypothetical protein
MNSDKFNNNNMNSNKFNNNNMNSNKFNNNNMNSNNINNINSELKPKQKKQEQTLKEKEEEYDILLHNLFESIHKKYGFYSKL